MGEIISLNTSEIDTREQMDLVEVSDDMLSKVRASINPTNSFSMPIAQMTTLGAGVSSVLPSLRTVTQTTSVSTQGLYRLANASVGDTLKVAKNGNFWGAFKTADGASKFAQLAEAGPITATTETVAAVNPAMLMMSVALFSIEQKLGKIEEMEKQIISFLEIEKESEIEADVETLSNIITTYKHNWDNEHFRASNHKMVLDIQRTARKNMLAYQKKVGEVIEAKKLIVAQNMVNTSLKDLQKKFQYYRLSLYTYAMASLIEIMLSGNFKEESILTTKREIEKRTSEYQEMYGKCSAYLKKMSEHAVETNVLKGVGIASRAVGKVIGNISATKEYKIGDFFLESGDKLSDNAKGVENSVIESFAQIRDPETLVFVEKMDDMIRIYNHTEEIYVDKDNVYLI